MVPYSQKWLKMTVLMFLYHPVQIYVSKPWCGQDDQKITKKGFVSLKNSAIELGFFFFFVVIRLILHISYWAAIRGWICLLLMLLFNISAGVQHFIRCCFPLSKYSVVFHKRSQGIWYISSTSNTFKLSAT